MKRLTQFIRIYTWVLPVSIVTITFLLGAGAYAIVSTSRQTPRPAPVATNSVHTPASTQDDKKKEQTSEPEETTEAETPASAASSQPLDSTPSVQVSVPVPLPAASILLKKVSSTGFIFETTNFSSKSYLRVLEPVKTLVPQQVQIDDYSVSIGATYGDSVIRQVGGVVSSLPVGIMSGDTYKFYICENVGGACGLRSNVFYGTATHDNFGLYIAF